MKGKWDLRERLYVDDVDESEEEGQSVLHPGHVWQQRALRKYFHHWMRKDGPSGIIYTKPRIKMPFLQMYLWHLQSDSQSGLKTGRCSGPACWSPPESCWSASGKPETNKGRKGYTHKCLKKSSLTEKHFKFNMINPCCKIKQTKVFTIKLLHRPIRFYSKNIYSGIGWW